MYSNDYARNCAIANYKVDPNKTSVIPFRAKFEIAPGRSEEQIEQIIQLRPRNKYLLLFIAGEWFNKRGDYVIDIPRRLYSQNFSFELHIVGAMSDQHEELPDYIIYHGCIDKSREGGLKKIKELYALSHFVILPSIAECAPV